VRFLVDAQLPRKFCVWLAAAGHNAKHTLDLPRGNRTPDTEIVEMAIRENRIVVTKDDDFVESFFLHGKPPRLLLVSTGNIGNTELEKLINANLSTIGKAFEQYRFVEIGKDMLVTHE
jgi:predicted nuclease of predicted toxin-antitoxin system